MPRPSKYEPGIDAIWKSIIEEELEGLSRMTNRGVYLQQASTPSGGGADRRWHVRTKKVGKRVFDNEAVGHYVDGWSDALTWLSATLGSSRPSDLIKLIEEAKPAA